MNTEQYNRIYRWFTQRPKAFCALKLLYRISPLLVVAAYLALLGGKAWGALQCYGQGEPFGQAVAELCVLVCLPAGVCLAGTVLRAVYNTPRPYEKAGFTPLIAKDKKGHACPSRHALSASVIAMAWWATSAPISCLLAIVAVVIAALRVLAGVHSLRDVVVGLMFGGIGGGILLLVAYRLLLWS